MLINRVDFVKKNFYKKYLFLIRLIFIIEQRYSDEKKKVMFVKYYYPT